MKEFIAQLELLNATASVDVPEPDPVDPVEPEPSTSPHPLRLAESGDLTSAWKPDAHELRLFARTGLHLHDPGTLAASHRGFWPAFLHAYRSLKGYRRPWPVVMEASDTGVHLCTLSRWADDQPPSDDTPRLESWLREASGERAVSEWANLRSRAPEGLTLPASAAPQAWLLQPSAEALTLIWGRTVAAVNAGRRRALLEEVESLRTRLSDLLRVEAEDLPTAHDPDRLRHATGGSFSDTIDFGSFSRLMDEAPHATPTDTDRIERVRGILFDLNELPSLLYAADVISEPQRTVKSALEALHTQVERFTRLILAVQMARLEVENRYRSDLHDAVFAAFSYQAIPASERKAFPPVPVHLTLRADDDPEPLLLALREPGMLRVLLSTSDLFNERAEHHPVVDISRRLVADADTFVQQSSVSHADFLLEGLTLAARAQGNALVSVALGTGDAGSESAFLSAAVLSESRAFPCFRFDPEQGTDWADWMRIDANEAFQSDWVDHAIDGVEDRVQLTPADLLFLDPRFADQFHLLDPSITSPDLLDVAGWTRLSPSERSGRIPFLWLSTPDGLLARAVASPMILRAVLLAGKRWHVLQEWAGVESSLVQRRTEAIRAELEAERDAAITAAREAFEARMQESTETLARAIVENIAASLLDGQGAVALTDPGARARLATQAAKPAPKPVEKQPDAPAEPAAPEPEPAPAAPALSLDEAYIDTPLCTSCNECTDRNAQIFAYDDNKQAYIKNAGGGPFRDIVMAAEKCPVRIIHPGKPLDASESDLDEWVERARPFQ